LITGLPEAGVSGYRLTRSRSFRLQDYPKQELQVTGLPEAGVSGYRLA